MHHDEAGSLERHLHRYDRLLEVGIGRRGALAGRLAATGRSVTAIDIVDVEVPEGVEFVRADVGSIAPASLPSVDAVYARRLPPELHRPTARVAAALDAELLFTTLGTEVPLIEVRLVTGRDGPIYVLDRGESNRI